LPGPTANLGSNHATHVTADEHFYDVMKRYVRFDESDRERLALVHRLAEPHFGHIIETFYDRILEFEDAHAVLKSDEQIGRLKRSLRGWLVRLLVGPYDRTQLEAAVRVGDIHVGLGLSHAYVMAAATVIRGSLHDVVDQLPDADVRGGLHQSIDKALDLELAVMAESYRDHYRARLKRAAELNDDAPRSLGHRRAMEYAPALVLGLDERGCVSVFNLAAEKATGYGADEVQGQSFGDLVLPAEARVTFLGLFQGLVEAAASGGGTAPAHVELPLLTRAGKVRAVRWHFAASTSGEGSMLVVAVGTDVTDERALEESARRTERLAAVGSLAAGLAHEIRNPLNGAQLHIRFIERGLRRLGVDDPDTHEALEVVQQEITRLGTLVREFLDFARPRALDRAETSLKEVYRRA
jgi:PAS domain S-box-containing protein